MFSSEIRLACGFLILVTVTELSQSASYGGRNAAESVRCYDCDYDPSDQQGKGPDRQSDYGQYGAGNGNGRIGVSGIQNRAMNMSVRRGFQRCALDKQADDQHYVRETECKSGVCFIRKDFNGLVYRGCADPKNLPLDVDTKIQCQPQGLRPAVWWFCNGTRCNSENFEGQSGICSGNSSSNKTTGNQMTGSKNYPSGDIGSNPYIVGSQKGSDRGGSREYSGSQSKPKSPMSAYHAPNSATDTQQSYGSRPSSNSQQYHSQHNDRTAPKYEKASAPSYSGSEMKEQTTSAPYAPGQSRQSMGDSGRNYINSYPSYGRSNPTQAPAVSRPSPEAKPDPDERGHMIAIPVISVNAGRVPQSSVQTDSAANKNAPHAGYAADDPMNYLLFMAKLHDKFDIKKENGGSDSYRAKPPAPVEPETNSRSSPPADKMWYYPSADASGRPRDLTSGKSVDTMKNEPAAGYGQSENLEGPMTTAAAAAASAATGYGSMGEVSSNSEHDVSSDGDNKEQPADNIDDNSFNPCDGQCQSNPSGLFPDPSGQEFFIQCGPGRDPDFGTPCQCCRPQRMQCPNSTIFNHVTKVCSGSIGLGADSGSASVTAQTDRATSGAAENQLPEEMIFGYN